jgi:hypothetical protein
MSTLLADIGTASIVFSPIILAAVITSMSFIFQNINGFVYLAFLIAATLSRNAIASSFLQDSPKPSGGCFNKFPINYSEYDNEGFSIFVSTFSFFYVCMPMFLNNDINFWVFAFLLLYIAANIIGKKNCPQATSTFIANIVGGSLFGLFITYFMYSGGGSKYLLYNEISSSKSMCSMANKQTFKCLVYKNGELIGSKTK